MTKFKLRIPFHRTTKSPSGAKVERRAIHHSSRRLNTQSAQLVHGRLWERLCHRLADSLHAPNLEVLFEVPNDCNLTMHARGFPQQRRNQDTTLSVCPRGLAPVVRAVKKQFL